jgi:hypothetical protein
MYFPTINPFSGTYPRFYFIFSIFETSFIFEIYRQIYIVLTIEAFNRKTLACGIFIQYIRSKSESYVFLFITRNQTHKM